MLSIFDNFAASPMGMLLVLILSAFLWGFLVHAVARQTLLPTVYRFLAEQQQQQQQELERQARLHFYLDDVRRRAMAAAAAAEYEQRLRADQAWQEMMADHSRRFNEALQTHERTVSARRAEESVQLRRDLEVSLRLLEADDYQLEDAVAFAEQFDDEQHFHAEKGSMLEDSHNEDPKVFRGDRMAERYN